VCISGIKWELFVYFYKDFFEDMTTFIGDYPCKLDVKGRLMFPAAFKKQMSSSSEPDKFVVKKDIYEKCLIVYPMDEWDRQMNIIRSKINPYNKEHNRFLREFSRGVAEVVIDNANRLLIPKRLLDLVGIEKEIVLAGQMGKIEMWDKNVYDQIREPEDDFAALAEKILGGSITDEDKK